jgi:tripartite-type tricarboxylate transporter receptor subunit TctC
MQRLFRPALLALACLSLPALAQTWPARQVRIVLPFGAGGSTDAIARTLGQKFSEAFGQPVVIDNRPGAAGAIATDHVAKSAPDGYTLLMATTSTHSVLPVLKPQLPYDPARDFALIGMVARAPNVLIVSPTVPAANVRELIALAKAKPGSHTFASSGTGTITHLIGELFNASAGIKAVHAPYKTGVQAVPDVVSGQVAWLFDSIVWSLPQIRAGKLKGLAVTSRERSPLAPDLPTVAEAGLPGFEGVTWFGLVAPAAVPKEVAGKLNAELNRLLQTPDMRDKLAAQGAEAAPGSPEDFARVVREDAARWGKVIRDAGVKVE